MNPGQHVLVEVRAELVVQPLLPPVLEAYVVEGDDQVNGALAEDRDPALHRRRP